MSNFNSIKIKDIIADIQGATVDITHPYRNAVLSTMHSIYGVQSRTLILRDVTPDWDVILYTDYRSPKVLEIESDNRISLLFYDNIRQIQIRIQGLASILKSGTLVNEHIHKLKSHSYNDYNTLVPPGSPLTIGDDKIEREKKLNFGIVKIKIHQLEYLKLSRDGHQRIIFKLQDKSWEQSTITP